MSAEKFDQWCIVELFGHQRIAGRVTEQTVGGCNFVRVDVPAIDGRPAFTRMFGQGAIYAINPVSEELARLAATSIRAEPIQQFDLPTFASNAIREAQRTRALTTTEPDDGDEERF